MRRVMCFVLVCLLALGFSSLLLAQENKESVTGKDMGQGMKGHKKMMKPGPMMGGMPPRSVVATSDGGVVVLIGNKIIKYDKNLNLVKEAEIKIDWEAMHKEMQEMMKNCPMMKGGMGGEGGGPEEPGEEPAEATGPNAPAQNP